MCAIKNKSCFKEQKHMEYIHTPKAHTHTNTHLQKVPFYEGISFRRVQAAEDKQFRKFKLIKQQSITEIGTGGKP